MMSTAQQRSVALSEEYSTERENPGWMYYFTTSPGRPANARPVQMLTVYVSPMHSNCLVSVLRTACQTVDHRCGGSFDIRPYSSSN